jgi:hypothetical protein
VATSDNARQAKRALIVCCIEDSSESSMSALMFAARMTRGRSSRGGADLVVVCVSRPPLFVLLDPAVDFRWPGIAADVEAMIAKVSALFGLAIRVDEVGGWSQAEIVSIARARGSDAVILPMLDDDAGPLKRWNRRSLVSGLIDRTHAVVLDEYESLFAGNP